MVFNYQCRKLEVWGYMEMKCVDIYTYIHVNRNWFRYVNTCKPEIEPTDISCHGVTEINPTIIIHGRHVVIWDYSQDNGLVCRQKGEINLLPLDINWKGMIWSEFSIDCSIWKSYHVGNLVFLHSLEQMLHTNISVKVHSGLIPYFCIWPSQNIKINFKYISWTRVLIKRPPGLTKPAHCPPKTLRPPLAENECPDLRHLWWNRP